MRNYVPFHSVPLTGMPPHFYFFDIANARFFVLDANAFYGAKFAPSLEPGSKQYKWLEHYLSRTDATWKFVAVHEPVYSTGAHGAIEAEQKTLEPLFLKYGVDVVFQGHDHDYERTVPLKNGQQDEENGVVYVTLGGGGSTLYIQRTNEPWSEKFLPTYHFASVKVDDSTFDMTVYNKDGDVIDTLEIEK
jgi:N-acetylneuraminic acid mutarotase